jgi:purine-binding chemotaxis protein CheW
VRDETRIIVLEIDQSRIGMAVDQVLEVRKVQADQISMPPELIKGMAAEFINGIVTIGGRTVVVLAVMRLLSSDEQVALAALTVEAGHG